MLEVKDLTKVYSGKGGVTVRALDGVSVRFPETGMVFLLGKSGSGKSTLLNVAGGLDKPDGGEIIVKGRSSKDFSAADFDSYRNTFIGFVFQEYNILNEFTIEQNIALALQLQSKPNDKKAVQALLEQVDLKDYGKRKPNTLSGGQKQRVAIARALIKQPEIIMADEPTGALDSATGKQVLDTLKKLSETKLVIIVSHDREFAEHYGDRIIELRDGKIISDVTKTFVQPENAEENVTVLSDDTIRVKRGEDITDEDVKKIAALLKKSKGEAIITSSEHDLKDVKRVCKINEDGSKESFKETTEVPVKEYDGSKTRFIKSRLPLSHAVKMGASGLKSKPIRLIFTILLSVAAFVMFGVASTFMLYDENYSISEALKKANYPSVVITKSYKVTNESVRVNNQTGEESVQNSYTDYRQALFGVSEAAKKSKSGLRFAGIFDFVPSSYSSSNYSLNLIVGDSAIAPSFPADVRYYYPNTDILGFSDCGATYLESNGFSLIAGSYPSSGMEIAIPEYLAEWFVNTDGAGVSSAADMVGKKIKIIGGGIFNGDERFTVSGVYSVGAIPQKYGILKTNVNSISDKEREKLVLSFADYLGSSFHKLIFVHEDFYETFAPRAGEETSREYIDATYYKRIRFEATPLSGGVEEWSTGVFTEKQIQRNAGKFSFYTLNGTPIASSPIPRDGEIYISLNQYQNYLRNAVWAYMYVLDLDYAVLDADFYNLSRSEAYQTVRQDVFANDNINKILSYLESWHQTLAYKHFLLDAASYLRENYDERYYSGAFSDAYEAIQNFKSQMYDLYNSDASYDGSFSSPSEGDWKVLENALSSLLTEKPQAYYGLILQVMNNKGDRLFGDDTWSYVDSLKGATYSPEDFEIVKGRIDEALSAQGLSAEKPKGLFAFRAEDIVSSVYYLDATGTPGSLALVGYFDSSANLGASYYISESWMTAHAVAENTSEYSWTNVYKTDYVAPLDAKYKMLISPTQNTQAETAAALAAEGPVKYDIQSMVYMELTMFISIINNLQKIFLIVGLVLGAIAALFLLNFISVSISAKRKDIGILRAVGARGSDVFKIFYAEAFIIAILCFILAAVGSFVTCFFLNRSLVDIVSIRLLHFGIVNIALILGVSVVVSVIATFFPVFFAAKKSPVESIRAL